ncbi:MAG TPA: hypothetical protein VLR26_15025 [Frankiaceae bacterium]|nr:hypothetical protein [Frankiaceae bacterium]
MSSPARLATSDEYHVIAAAAREAEDAGDLAGARRLIGLLPDDERRRRWARSLDVGLALDDELERARWLLEPALRHGFGAGADVGSTARARLIVLAGDVLRARGAAALAASVESSHAAVQDPLLVDVALFDLGMLGRYRDEVLVPLGHRHAGVVESWLDRDVSAFEVQAVEPGGLVLHDLVHRQQTAVQRPGSEPGPELGDLLYGRVLPVRDRACFGVAPVRVDRVTARRVVRALARRAPLIERLRAVASYQRRSAAG